MKRRLAAILAVDLVGYSRLIRKDEAGTLATIKRHRGQFIEPIIWARNGRVVKLMGDGLLIEFPSAVEAVRSAIDIQHYVNAENEGVPEDEKKLYRLGINIGDIVVDDDDIYGDGVNVAARLEALAEPGGVEMSRNVFDQITDILDLTIIHRGEQQLKNIAVPVDVFSLVFDRKTDALVSPISTEKPKATGQGLKIAAASLLMVIAVTAVGLVFWQPWNATTRSMTDNVVDRSVLSGKPSIAVMAFDTLNNDQSKNYLSDGLSENILTALARFPDFFVVARQSTFSYKDKPVEVQQVAQELHVRYVVKGSIQFAGDRLRVTAQLIDAISGKTIWAERYDRKLQDIFAVQDEITRTIASTLVANVSFAEYSRIKFQPTENLSAYELYKSAQNQGLKFTKEANIRAMRLARQAIELDPNFASAYVELAWAHVFGYRWGWTEISPSEKSLELAFEMARKAIELEPLNSKGYQVLANATTQTGDLKKALSVYEKAISLNPNSASVLADSSDPLVYIGRADEAVERMKAAIRLNPHHEDWYLWNLGWAQYFAKDYEGALASIQKMNKVPDRLKRTLAPILLRLGRENDARSVIKEFLEAVPDYDIAEAKTAPFTDHEYLDRWLDDLRKLGVPENAS